MERWRKGARKRMRDGDGRDGRMENEFIERCVQSSLAVCARIE